MTFTATDATTTLSVAGNQVPSWELAEQNGLFLNGTGANLLGSTCDFVAAAIGCDSYAFNDGSSVAALAFGGVNAGYVDTYSQSIATTIGDSYTYDLLLVENSGTPNQFIVVSTSGTAVPAPVSRVLLGLGLAGVALIRCKSKQQ